MFDPSSAPLSQARLAEIAGHIRPMLLAQFDAVIGGDDPEDIDHAMRTACEDKRTIAEMLILTFHAAQGLVDERRDLRADPEQLAAALKEIGTPAPIADSAASELVSLWSNYERTYNLDAKAEADQLARNAFYKLSDDTGDSLETEVIAVLLAQPRPLSCDGCRITVFSAPEFHGEPPSASDVEAYGTWQKEAARYADGFGWRVLPESSPHFAFSVRCPNCTIPRAQTEADSLEPNQSPPPGASPARDQIRKKMEQTLRDQGLSDPRQLEAGVQKYLEFCERTMDLDEMDRRGLTMEDRGAIHRKEPIPTFHREPKAPTMPLRNLGDTTPLSGQDKRLHPVVVVAIAFSLILIVVVIFFFVNH